MNGASFTDTAAGQMKGTRGISESTGKLGTSLTEPAGIGPIDL